MNHTAECCIPASHPSLPGHFPGNPIVPAVVILNEVIATCNDWQPTIHVSGVNNAKFIAPLLPDQHFNISLSHTGKSTIAFECLINDKTLVSGKLSIDVDPS